MHFCVKVIDVKFSFTPPATKNKQGNNYAFLRLLSYDKKQISFDETGKDVFLCYKLIGIKLSDNE